MKVIMSRLMCEYKGAVLPHPATKMLGWSLDSGRTWKLSCDEHASKFGGPGYSIAGLEAFVDESSRTVDPIVTPESLEDERRTSCSATERCLHEKATA